MKCKIDFLNYLFLDNFFYKTNIIGMLIIDSEIELRFSEDYDDPFPLYPKEELSLKPTELKIV